MSTLGIDAVVNPPQITVSSILEHVRRGRIRDVHSVLEGHGEVLKQKFHHPPFWSDKHYVMQKYQKACHLARL